MYKMKANLLINRKNCWLDCIKYFEAPFIPRKTELISFSEESAVRVREVTHCLLRDNSFEIRLLLEELFLDDIEKSFGWMDCHHTDLIFYDHVWVRSVNVKPYTLYKSGYDGKPRIVLNKEGMEKFEKNFC